MTSRRVPTTKISAIVSDVDGTLVTNDKQLTDRTRAAVAAIRKAGIPFSVISSRPPRGMAPLMKALGVDRPSAGFNGGVIVAPDLRPCSNVSSLPTVRGARSTSSPGAASTTWVFSGQDWLLQNAAGRYVEHETRTVGFPPIVVGEFGKALDTAAKIVGVSDKHDFLKECEIDLARLLGSAATVVRSQLYYLDITDRLANKGAGLLELARLLGVPPAEIAVIGDGSNDVTMFEQSGLSIAMGNAQPAVKEKADFVTASNGEEGFAMAVERFILGGER